jgi:hypothetical protein
VIRDGKIAAVGADVQPPAGAKVIDGTGRFVMPGIIDAHSHSAAEAINEGTQSVTSEVRIEDVIRQDGIALYRELAGGTTTISILHGSANTIGGQNAVVKLRYGLPVDSMRFEGAPPGIKFALGENVRQTNNTPAPGEVPRYPSPAPRSTVASGRSTTGRRRRHRPLSVPRSFRRAAISSSMRWWRSSRASASCTATPTVPTRSS